MSFNMKWKLRKWGIKILTLPLSMFILLSFFVFVRMEKFEMFPSHFYNGDLSSVAQLNSAYWNYLDLVLKQFAYWFIAAIVLDLVIRRVLFVAINRPAKL